MKKTMMGAAILAGMTLCGYGADSAGAPDAVPDKFANLNGKTAGRVESVEQLSEAEVAALGKREGIAPSRLLGSIKADGFGAKSVTEVARPATPEELAEKAAIKASKGLKASIKGESEGTVARVRMGVDDFDTKDGSSRSGIPEGFEKTKE